MIPPSLYLPCYRPEPVLSPTDRANEVLAAVAAQSGLAPSDLSKRTPKHKIAHARQEVMRRLHREHGWSLHHVAEFMGRQTVRPFHHTTVLFGVRQAEARLSA